jgi:hypothetical protein
MISDKNVSEFADTVFERMNIRIKKELDAPKPWTKDTVFQNWFFCNVFRRIDKTTEWMMNNIYLDYEDAWALLMFARYISRIDVLEDVYETVVDSRQQSLVFGNSGLTFNERMKMARDKLILRMIEHKPINTAAFITSPMLGDMGPTKAHYIYNLITKLKAAGFDEMLETDNDKYLEDLHSYLCTYRATGTFMAYQYLVDFTYVDRYLATAADIQTWTAVGPGSMRGLMRLMDLPLKGRLNKREWGEGTAEIHDKWKEECQRKIPNKKAELLHFFLKEAKEYNNPIVRANNIVETTDYHYSYFDNIRMQDTEHWLCEYDKYKRGGSRKRRYYGA